MFHRSYHFVQELYFTQYLFVLYLCILYMPRSRDDVHIVSTETMQEALASNSQPAPAGDNYL